MRYAILIWESPEDLAEAADPATAPAYWAGWQAYSQAMNPVTTGGAPLDAVHTASTVRLRDGKRLVQDGPYADTREALGGFFLIDVPDLDAALDWAAKCPAARTGAIEVRPIQVMPGA